MSQILLINKFNPEKVVLGKVSDKNVSYYYPSSTSKDEFIKLRIQTPKMRIPFNIEEIKTRDNKIFMKKITLSTDPFGDTTNVKNIESFRDKINQLDQQVFSLLTPEFQKKTFYKSLYKGKDPNKYMPTMKLNIPVSHEGFCSKTNFFDSKKNLVSESQLNRGSIVSIIIRFDGLWYNKDKMGTNWTVEQLMIYDQNNEFNFKKES
jgi:hypothetical protein